MLEDLLRSLGGDYQSAATNITNEKYKYAKSRFHLTLYKLKNGKFKIQDYHGNSFGLFHDVDMAKKNYVELYEKQHGSIMPYQYDKF